MSEHHLPDDVRRWPRDPYQVLGIAPRCDPNTARKAYTRLIRRYKPEQFPEQFRLVREAYDSVKRDTQFYSTIALPADTSAEDAVVAETATGENGDAVSSEPIAAEAQPKWAPRPDELQTLWDMACDGSAEEAYRRLREMYQINPNGSELPLRLHALLLAMPELDLRNTPCDWLVRGMAHEVAWGPCRQLYRREIEDRPEEVLTDRFLGLIDAATSTGTTAEYLGWRWDSLLRLQRLELITDDLERARSRLEPEDEVAWVRLLLRAADYLAWHPPGPDGGRRLPGVRHGVRPSADEFDTLCDTIEPHVHVHAVLQEELSRLDFLRDLSRGWLQVRRFLRADGLHEPALLGVVPMTWTSPFEHRHRILASCREVTDDPHTALADLDQVHRYAPLIAAHLGQTLGWVSYVADPRDPADVQAALSDCLLGLFQPLGDQDYSLYRQHLLELCLTEAVAPEWIVPALGPQGTSPACQMILDDWPLRTVCLARRMILG